ncbi:MAG: elongation factor G [Gemmatimonadetes bacterium]|nr:elongation factor G [Gemmatimonadota bacterium]NNF12384.1 elongation factor G [Gemmatimonadota bacterium]NNL30225.1 elongation factor G [Gemmatimonadota bacterium]
MASAKEYTTDRIRNVAVLGHGSSGKTTLIDALCFVAGTSKRLGDVDEGSALTMHAPEEHQHGISLQLTPAYAEHLNTKINLLDTPGYLDFTGEALSAIRVADAAIIVVSATSGVEVGTRRVWRYCEARGIPRIFFVSNMDKEHADFDGVFGQIKRQLTQAALPVEIPIGEGPGFSGIINLFSEKAHIYKEGTNKGEYHETDIPDELKDKEAQWETELQETLATTDENLLESYLEGGAISREEAIEAMARGMGRGEVFPVFCGSAKQTYGMRALLKKIVELCPNPAEARPEVVNDVEYPAEDSAPLAALVFKTAAEPHVGELSYFRVFSGSVSNGDEVTNASDGQSEKLNHLGVPMGKERHEVSTLHAGDIGVVAKLKHTHTNDTLCKGKRLQLDKIDFPKADISIAIKGRTRNDEDKLGEVIPRIHEEDPAFSASFDPELHQTIARGLGEMHLEVQFERMARKYGVEVETEQPRIAYRETLTKQAEGQGRHKKQSGGRGQFGDCWVRLKPLPRGSGYEFINAIKGGVIPGKYVPSVDRGIQEAAQRGIVAGYPIVDFAAECYDGSYHAVDSSDIAFKLAGSHAFRSVAEKCRPILLEPVVEVAVLTPDEYVGDIMGDLTSRRGKVQGMEPVDGRTTVRAIVPESELYKYAATLRSITQGRGHHTREAAGYEPAPDHVAAKVRRDREALEAS